MEGEGSGAKPDCLEDQTLDSAPIWSCLLMGGEHRDRFLLTFTQRWIKYSKVKKKEEDIMLEYYFGKSESYQHE